VLLVLPSEEKPVVAKQISARTRLFIGFFAGALVLGLAATGVVLERTEQSAASLPTAPNDPNQAESGTPAPTASGATHGAEAPRGPIASQMSKACTQSAGCTCLMGVAAELVARAAPGEALALLDMAPEACRASEEALGIQVEALARRGDVSAQQRARQLSLEHPANRRVIAVLARLAYAADDRTAARASADRALALGKSSAAELVLGRLELDENQTVAALQRFRKALELEPNQLEAHFFSGVTYRRIRNYHKAREALLTAARLNDALPESRVELASMAAAAGALDEARNHYRKLTLLLPPDDVRLRGLEAQLGKGNASEGSTYKVGTRASQAKKDQSSKDGESVNP
jgi:tetratricopeptide (TPR) repeat protein